MKETRGLPGTRRPGKSYAQLKAELRVQNTQGERQAGVTKGGAARPPTYRKGQREIQFMTRDLIMPDTFWEPCSPVEVLSGCFYHSADFCVTCHWIQFLILKLSITGPELNDAIRGIIN